MSLQARPYQSHDLGVIASKYNAGITRQIVKYATGLGKTPLFAMLREKLGFQRRVIVLAHRDELVQQAVDKLKSWNPGVRVGVEKAQSRSNGETFLVASVQTIGRKESPRLLQLNPFDFDVLIIDECHHACAASYQVVINHFAKNPKLLLLGVTATVNRADGRGLNKNFQEIVADRDILFGINNGWLSDLKGIRIRTATRLDDLKTRAGDFQQGPLQHRLNNPRRNDLLVRSWKEHALGRQTVMFTAGIDHAKALAEVFKARGVVAEAVWGDDPNRHSKLRQHRAQNIQVLLNSDLLTEGYDDWRVSCIGMARSTQSEGLYTQMVGRGTRIPDEIGNLLEARAKGQRIEKKDCILLDFVDVTAKHSLVTLPSLFGMYKDMDLHGRSIVSVVEEIKKLKEAKPYLNLEHVKDVDQLQAYAERVDLFKVEFAPEIIQISEHKWYKTGDNAYVLLLMGGESVTVIKDMLDKWHVLGAVNTNKLFDTYETFDDAIRQADYMVHLLGGRSLVSSAKLRLKKDDEEPSPAQLMLAKRLRLSVPAGATFGDLRLALNLWTLKNNQRKEARTSVVGTVRSDLKEFEDAPGDP
jgi:superfamily II DNA or RNA helicase